MKKLLTIAVPSFNSQDYLSNCLDSLVIGGDEVEVIVIDDGSTDNTGKIAEDYKTLYPNIVRVIHQPNSGHGEGVNQGLLNATGIYYKVCDSDDLLAKKGYLDLLATIRKQVEKNELPDLFVCDFLYEHIYDDESYVSAFARYMKPNKIQTWDKVKTFSFHHMLLMHALVYRRDTLLKSNTILPKHCFYVDDYFSFKPLAYCKTLYYLPEVVYRYRIGRPDQSVTKENMFKRYKQQLTVMNLVLSSFTYEEINVMPKGLRKYLLHALSVLNLTTLFFVSGGKDNQPQRKKDFKKYLADLKSNDMEMYKHLRYKSYYSLIYWLPYIFQKRIITFGYNVTAKVCKCG